MQLNIVRNKTFLFLLSSFLFLLTMLAALCIFPSKSSVPLTKANTLVKFYELPLYFERNDGQFDPRIHYLTRGYQYTTYFTPQEVEITLQGKEQLSSALKLQFIGANPNPQVQGLEKQECTSNYFIGNDSQKWRTHIPNYAKVVYQEIYPGINAVFYGNKQQLEYDICVAPGANPNIVRLHIEGIKDMVIDPTGDLRLSINDDHLILMHKPFIYQMIDGKTINIPGEFILLAKNDIGFKLGTYDLNQELVIDPTLSYSTYLGGNDYDQSNAIAVDSDGNAYVTGSARSSDFPTTMGAFDTTLGGIGIQNAFITKMNSTGTALVYSTYLGGNIYEQSNAIAIDGSGNAYVTGLTQSSNFPTTMGAFQTAKLGLQDAFITKLNSTGTALIYSTYLGGGTSEQGSGIAVDSDGNAYITGSTTSSNFPTTVGAFQTTLNGFMDAFITKLNSGGSALVYSTYLGGNSGDHCYGITIDTLGNAYVTGYTQSSDFPTTPGAFQTTFMGVSDAFITKLNSTGTALIYSTYLGESGDNQGNAIAIDASGNAYITGYTQSSSFPTTDGAFQTELGGADVQNAFISKFTFNIPVVTSISPTSGPTTGGTTVTITGSKFTDTTAVSFGTLPAPSFTVNSDTQITAVSPAAAAGTIDITVTSPDGSSPTTIADQFTYNKVSTTTSLSASPNPANYGQTVTLTATVSPSAATANVSFFDGATLLGTATLSGGTATFSSSTFSVNSHSLTAVYGSDNTYAGSTSSTTTLTINQASTTTSLTASPNPSSFGQTVTLTATVSPSTATGTVSFFDGATLLGTATLSSGAATFSSSAFSVSSHSLTATYAGDSNFTSSMSSTTTLVVNKASTTTSLTASPNPASFGQTVTLTATVSPSTATGTVSFFDGVTLLGTATLSSGTATLSSSAFSVSSHSLTAIYAGNSNFTGSTSSTTTLVVNKASTTTSLIVSPNPVTYGQRATLTATVSPSTATGTVSFFDGVILLGTATLSSGTATFSSNAFSLSSHSLTATYAGDSHFTSSTSSATILVVKQAFSQPRQLWLNSDSNGHSHP
jgi:hypothetical protein